MIKNPEMVLSLPLYIYLSIYLSNKQTNKQLMVKNPEMRLGSSVEDARAIKQHPFFRGLDWEQLLNRQIPPPFIPDIVNDGIDNFDECFTSETPCVSPIDADPLNEQEQQVFKGFSYTSKWIDY